MLILCLYVFLDHSTALLSIDLPRKIEDIINVAQILPPPPPSRLLSPN